MKMMQIDSSPLKNCISFFSMTRHDWKWIFILGYKNCFVESFTLSDTLCLNFSKLDFWDICKWVWGCSDASAAWQMVTKRQIVMEATWWIVMDHWRPLIWHSLRGRGNHNSAEKERFLRRGSSSMMRWSHFISNYTKWLIHRSALNTINLLACLHLNLKCGAL